MREFRPEKVTTAKKSKKIINFIKKGLNMIGLMAWPCIRVAAQWSSLWLPKVSVWDFGLLVEVKVLRLSTTLKNGFFGVLV